MKTYFIYKKNILFFRMWFETVSNWLEQQNYEIVGNIKKSGQDFIQTEKNS